MKEFKDLSDLKIWFPEVNLREIWISNNRKIEQSMLYLHF